MAGAVGGRRRAPPLRPSIIPPFPSAQGPDRREVGSGAYEERRRLRAVWCWPTAKFLHWKPRRGASPTHTARDEHPHTHEHRWARARPVRRVGRVSPQVAHVLILPTRAPTS